MTGEKPSSVARKARLARALKANIAKRKAQAKAQADARPSDDPPPPEDADEDGCPN